MNIFFKKDKDGKIDVNQDLMHIIEQMAEMQKRIETLQQSYNILLDSFNKNDLEFSGLGTIKSRLEDLELWRAKIHNLMIEKTPIKKVEKISRFGSKFINNFPQ
jgi:hypothetical protein